MQERDERQSQERLLTDVLLRSWSSRNAISPAAHAVLEGKVVVVPAHDGPTSLLDGTDRTLGGSRGCDVDGRLEDLRML
jgi:hypothetical protein